MTAECEEAFLDIKRKLTNAPILAFPQLDVLFILDSDARDSGLGAVFSGSMWDVTWNSIGLSPPEIHAKPSQLASSGHGEETPQPGNLRDARQRTRETSVDSGDVEL